MVLRLAAGTFLVVAHAWLWTEPLTGATIDRELDPVEQELLTRSKYNDSWFAWWKGAETTVHPDPDQHNYWWNALFELWPKSMSASYDQPWWHTLWTATDILVVSLLNMTGGLIFGPYWPIIRVCLRILLGFSMIFAASLAMGFAWQAVSPLYNMVVAI
eukprot:742808-Amphidinium_carterae.1